MTKVVQKAHWVNIDSFLSVVCARACTFRNPWFGVLSLVFSGLIIAKKRQHNIHKKQNFARAWIIMASSWMNEYDLCIYAVSSNKRNRFLYQHSLAEYFHLCDILSDMFIVYIHFELQRPQSYPLASGSHWTKAAIAIVFIFATRNHHEYLSIVSRKENQHRKCLSYFVASAHFSFDLCKFEKKYVCSPHIPRLQYLSPKDNRPSQTEKWTDICWNSFMPFSVHIFLHFILRRHFIRCQHIFCALCCMCYMHCLIMPW